ncbi:type IV secretory system conjugative DNA transfer family protein [Ruegeria sp. NA]|jgi:type IV secretion system protein VirD4|nr:type IV secretory system conjugative DNA transfer family protein [Ruegeria sp. NA]MCX8954873.1 type IV secretory system conjugative DNA transfer family protein [Ruegeria sp. NA]
MAEFQDLPKGKKVAIAGTMGFIATSACAVLVIGLALEYINTRGFRGLDIWAIPEKFMAQPAETQQIMGLVAVVAVGVLTFAFVAAALRGPSTKYGDATFAKAPQLVQEGYASVLKLKDQLDSEIVFAKFGEPKDKNAIYYKPGPGVQKPHAMFIAPSGSGKTSGFVIPNVLRFNGSCVVLDIKGEIFQTTGARRAAMGDEVFVFDPENPDKSHSYNPLRRAARADNLDRRWEEVIQVATQMFDTPSSSAQGFMGGVEGMFCAMAMLAIKRKRPYISEVLRLVKTTKQKDYEKMAEEVGYARAADEFLNLAAEESKILRSTISVMNNSGLQLWRNPSVARATQGNDINFEDLRRRPTSIYFSVPGKKVKEFRTLIRLFFLDLVNTIETVEPGEDEPFKVLMLLDEFQRLGHLERVVEAYDTMRSFGGRIIVISQTLSRLQDIYGHEGVRAMLANAGTQMFAASEDSEVREHVSRSIGDKTVLSKSKSRALGKMEMGSISEREEGIRLLRPEHVGRLPENEVVLIREGKMPVIANKIRYFEDPYFMQFLGGDSPKIKGTHLDLAADQARDTAKALAEAKPAPAPAREVSEKDQELQAAFDAQRTVAKRKSRSAKDIAMEKMRAKRPESSASA